MTLTQQPRPIQTISQGNGESQWFRRKWFWLLAGLGILVLMILVLLSAPGPRDGSTYSRALTGYRSWYDYMLLQDVPIKRWQRPYDELTGTGQTLIQVWGTEPKKPKSGYDDATLQTWVEQGNTLIILSWRVVNCPVEACWRGQVTAAPFSSRLSSDAGPVLIETTRRRAQDSDRQPILADRYGNVVWSESSPKGTIIYGAYPWIAANIFADQPDNYEFLAQLTQQSQGTIWVDEWIHGYRDPAPNGTARSSPSQDVWDYLARTPVALLLVQSGLILLLLIWGQNHRFGNAQSLKAPVKDNSEQYIQALGAILNKAGQTGFVLSQLGQVLRQSLATQLGLVKAQGGSTRLPTDEDLATHWSQVTGRPDQELLELLQQTGQTRRLNDRALLDWVSKAESTLRGLS